MISLQNLKYHTQQHVYDPQNPENSTGSCYPTVYACLLGLELHQVPHFNLLYWKTREKKNLSVYFRNRFLGGDHFSEFQGAEHHKDNFNHFAHLSNCLWDNVRMFWLAAQGYEEAQIDDIDGWLKENVDVPYMVSGVSSRGIDHVVIYVNGKLLHDPHPSREGLVTLWTKPYTYLKKVVEKSNE